MKTIYKILYITASLLVLSGAFLRVKDSDFWRWLLIPGIVIGITVLIVENTLLKNKHNKKN
jgi:hypothetical protein